MLTITQITDRALEIAELAAPDACKQSQNLIASQIVMLTQDACKDLIKAVGVALEQARTNPFKNDRIGAKFAMLEHAQGFLRAFKAWLKGSW